MAQSEFETPREMILFKEYDILFDPLNNFRHFFTLDRLSSCGNCVGVHYLESDSAGRVRKDRSEAVTISDAAVIWLLHGDGIASCPTYEAWLSFLIELSLEMNCQDADARLLGGFDEDPQTIRDAAMGAGVVATFGLSPGVSLRDTLLSPNLHARAALRYTRLAPRTI